MASNDPLEGSLAWRVRPTPPALHSDDESASFANRSHLTRDELLAQLRSAFHELRVEEASPVGRRWWHRLVTRNQNRLPEILQFCSVVLGRNATAQEFYSAYQMQMQSPGMTIFDALDMLVAFRTPDEMFEKEPPPERDSYDEEGW
jgi:hypothetical protein